MRVEVLYVAECPSHPAAVKLVKDVLAAQGLAPDIQEVLVADQRTADKLRFCGSPTIRINGRDVTDESPKSQTFGLSCRLSAGPKRIGLPSAEMVRLAIAEAIEGDRQ